jgi:hypothetical protein
LEVTVRGLIGEAAAVLRRQALPVVAILIAIIVPANVMTELPEGSVLPLLGSLAMTAGDLAILAVLLADLQGRPLSTITAGAILRAWVRLLVAYLILGLLAVILLIPFLAIWNLQQVMPMGIGLGAYVRILLIAAVPVLLFDALCLREPGGPMRLWSRSWQLARPRLGQMRFLFGVLTVLGFTVGSVRYLGGPAAIGTAVAAGIVVSVVQYALVAVFYVRLAAEVPVVDGPPRASASFGVMRTLGQAPSPQPRAPLATKRVYRRRP